MYIPTFKHNLLSVQKMCEDGNYKVMFYKTFCMVVDEVTGEVKGVGKGENGLYYMLDEPVSKTLRRIREQCTSSTYMKKISSCNKNAMTASSYREVPSVIRNVAKLSKETLWHHRMGHTPMKKLMMIEEIGVKGTGTDVCLACPLAKFTKLPFHKSDSRATEKFALVHIDTWGPYKVNYRGKFRYFLTLVDDYSRVTWVHLLKLKSDAFAAIRNFAVMIQTQFGKGIKILRSDNALELDDAKCKKFFW